MVNAIPDPASGLKPGSPFRDCSDCPEMVVLPPGEFRMGSSRNEEEHSIDEAPRHPVKLTYRLAVGKFEVTRGQFGAFAKATSYGSRAICQSADLKSEFKLGWEDPAHGQHDTHPVVCVTWRDTQAYVKWLSAKTGRVYRLLSESEWEYAVRAGSDSPFYWAETYADGVSSVCSQENLLDQTVTARMVNTEYGQRAKQDGVACSDGHVFTAPVGAYKSNAFGLYDMGGNVSEWVMDCPSSYTGAPGTGAPIEPAPGDCETRMFRGGSWWGDITRARSAHRGGGMYGTSARPYLGFRVVREF